ncbi:Rieske (2Fe-2S) protein [Natrinema salsiterrestre]|uniref:Rieske 2Fe-2S domain-containing protein n=1 Tax=Natrinema salsiterrestre TaxID=2950540 RepID=A0A9Q4L5H7_9EURY|nr:Rieske 2Fe-2S domain-containing protein [Natrinema salsiterrestre]MDF9745646.1 Rieske 2Fe-2S domain-containing protein [Natrinema salsiterrestre]
MDGERITALSEVPDDSTVLFRVADDVGEEREAILVADAVAATDGGEPTGSEPESSGDGVACWLNYCQHLTHIKLDKGSGAPMRDGELICANHGAYFEADTGYCSYGPCEGAYLTDLEVTVSEGEVYLTDDEYEFVGMGPVESDDLDRASTSNVEF